MEKEAAERVREKDVTQTDRKGALIIKEMHS